MNSPRKPTSYTSLKRALSNCVDALTPCVEALRSIDNQKLEKHAIAVTRCYKNCKRALSIIENNSEELPEFSSTLVMSCRKCIERCNQINLDIFRRAAIAVEDCLGEF